MAKLVGAHIPDLSSEVEFFDVLYLGVFIILSPAFDVRFYDVAKPPSSVVKELTYALRHFHSILHIFSQRFVIALEGEVVCYSYLAERMLGEFAAASVALAKAVYEPDGVVYEPDGTDMKDGITLPQFRGRIDDILLNSYPDVFPYYSRCLSRGHKDFLWTGPNVQILPRSDSVSSLIRLATTGEMVDLPSHRIYTEDLDPHLPIQPDTAPQAGKRRVREDGVNLEGDQAKKRGRQS